MLEQLHATVWYPTAFTSWSITGAENKTLAKPKKLLYQ